MTNKHFISLLASAIIITLSLGACHSSKTSVQGQQPEQSDSRVKELSPSQRVGELIASYSHRNAWNDLTVPVKCAISSPKSISVSGRMTMVKDQSISISMRMLGFEVAGMYADRDSVFIYEKLNKSMVAEPMSRLTAATGLTLSDIQDLMTGIICYPGTGLTTSNAAKLFNISAADGYLQLTPRDGRGWLYMLTSDNLPILRFASVTTSRADVKCTYEIPSKTNAGDFVPSFSINATAGKTKLAAKVSYTLSDIRINSGANVNKPSTKGYNKIALDRLVKVIGAM